MKGIDPVYAQGALVVSGLCCWQNDQSNFGNVLLNLMARPHRRMAVGKQDTVACQPAIHSQYFMQC